MFAFGSIVLTRFPFTDLSGDKRRPALVVSRDNDRRPDLVVAFITSVPQTGRDAARLDPLPGTGLKVASVVRFDKLATLDRSIIAGRLGTAPPQLACDAARGVLRCVRVRTTLKDVMRRTRNSYVNCRAEKPKAPSAIATFSKDKASKEERKINHEEHEEEKRPRRTQRRKQEYIKNPVVDWGAARASFQRCRVGGLEAAMLATERFFRMADQDYGVVAGKYA